MSSSDVPRCNLHDNIPFHVPFLSEQLVLEITSRQRLYHLQAMSHARDGNAISNSNGQFIYHTLFTVYKGTQAS